VIVTTSRKIDGTVATTQSQASTRAMLVFREQASLG